MEPIFIGAYWAQRFETREMCAQRIADFLEAIRGVDASLSAWFLKGRSRKAANVKIEISPSSIFDLLRTNNRDITGEPIAELGYSFNVWNGKTASLSATIGAFSSAAGNSVVLDSDPVLSEEAWRDLSKAAIRIFDPDALVVTSHDFIARNGGGMPWLADGWFTYKKGGELLHKHRLS